MLDNLNSKQKKIIAIIGVIILLVVLYFIYNKNQTIEQYDENILVKTENNIKKVIGVKANNNSSYNRSSKNSRNSKTKRRL